MASADDWISLPEPSPRAREIKQKLVKFLQEEIISAEHIFEEQQSQQDRWSIPPIMEDLKKKAKELGLWNLFLPRSYPEGAGLTNLEYAPMAEIMGRYPHMFPEICNCSAPDTGNMEVLAKYGSQFQKDKFLRPLLEGNTRSCFFMTEPNVASSDATNITTSIRKDGDSHYVINGKKWWASGAMDPRCSFGILLGVSHDESKPLHSRHSMIIVPLNSPGLSIKRYLSVFGYDDAPHGHAEVEFNDVRVPAENLIYEEGRGFEIAQGRLGPGRIHHCMRSLGMAERALELTIERSLLRKTFGKKLAEHSTIREQLAECRMQLDQARLLVLRTAHLIDLYGSRGARKEIAMIKIAIPRACCQVLDRAIQIHGGAGVSQDTILARFYAGLRTLRIADGPDDVHLQTLAKLELRDYMKAHAKL